MADVAVLKTIPEEVDVEHRVNLITLNLAEKKAYVKVHSAGRPERTVMVDIPDLFTTYSVSETQKNTIRAFIRFTIAEAVEVAENTITDEILADPV